MSSNVAYNGCEEVKTIFSTIGYQSAEILVLNNLQHRLSSAKAMCLHLSTSKSQSFKVQFIKKGIHLLLTVEGNVRAGKKHSYVGVILVIFKKML